MTVEVNDVRSILNDLIQTCKDGQQGFLDAAHHVKDLKLKAMFRELSQQRSRFAGELQQEVTLLGGEPEKKGSAGAALRRGWVDFKAKIAGESDPAVIKEAERGEDAAVTVYEKALQEVLPGNVHDVIERQYDDILKAQAQVHGFEGRSSGAA